MRFNPSIGNQTIRIVCSGIFSAITVPEDQSRNTSGAMPSFIVYFSSLCILILVLFVRLVTIWVLISPVKTSRWLSLLTKPIPRESGKSYGCNHLQNGCCVISLHFFQGCSKCRALGASRISFHKHATLGSLLCRTVLWSSLHCLCLSHWTEIRCRILRYVHSKPPNFPFSCRCLC